MIKNLTLTLVSIAVLYSSPCILSASLGGQVAHAAEQKPAQNVEQKTAESIKVPAMRNRVYSQLARAQKLADEGNGLEGFDVLDEVQDRIDTLNSYERAMLWNFYGFMYYGNDDVASAIESFKRVVNEKAIPLSLRVSTLYSMSQLFMQQQNYEQTIGYLTQWQVLNSKPLTSNQYVMFAQAYYQNKEYHQSLTHVSNAVELAESTKDIPKENWLILQRANYFELKQPKDVTNVLESLVRYYDKPKYWIQLGGMYGEIGEESKQLAVMESAWHAGYITESANIISLAQLYRYHNVPYKTATLLWEAMDNGTIFADERNLDMLAQAYIAAKNDDNAIPVLIRASTIADTGKFDASLAQAYLNLEQWKLASDSADQAIKRGGIERLGNMYLIKGMAFFNLARFDESLSAFTQAQKLPESKKIAKQWYNYVEREQGVQQSLVMLN
jgi:hypothetical protein